MLRQHILSLIALLMVVAIGAQAVELRWEQADGNLSIGDQSRLSVVLDEPLEVRTIELRIQFNDTILESQGGGMGQAYADLSCFVWEEFQLEGNEWYGFAVAVGADCFVVGPGELFVWDFEALAEGTAYINAIEVTLADRYAEIVEDVNLDNTTVVVGDGITGVEDLAPVAPSIQASPNPCNPRTTIRFNIPEARAARLTLYNVEGQRVRQLINGFVDAGWNSVPWDGRSDNGADVPSGVYLFRLDTSEEHLAGRVTLAR